LTLSQDKYKKKLLELANWELDNFILKHFIIQIINHFEAKSVHNCWDLDKKDTGKFN
jgi:hypothetical protein